MEPIQPPSGVPDTGLSRLRCSAISIAEVEIVVDSQNAAVILEKRQANDEYAVIRHPGLAVADV